MDVTTVHEHLGELDPAGALGARPRLVERIWERDHTVWQDDPTEVADRLGWLELPDTFADRVPGIETFAEQVAADGLTHVVVCGMGGSSLFPDVVRRSRGGGARSRLQVLDSTDPATIRRVLGSVPLLETLFVVSSKSGTTIETRSHLAVIWDRLTSELGVEAGRNVCAITDPGSELAELGHERGFRGVFENPTDIGGRYSALSYFGLVPAALAGVAPATLLGSAAELAAGCRRQDPAGNPALQLGLAMAAAARAGRDKLTVLVPDHHAAFGEWVEQLVAESTGKHGRGVTPVVGEPVGPPPVYGDDRFFVAWGHRPELDAVAAAGHPVLWWPDAGPDQLGAEVFRWEFATAVCGAVMGINPFDQPDVAAAKAATGRMLERGGGGGASESSLDDLLGAVVPGDHLALTVFADPESPDVERLERVRTALRDRLGVAVTLGIGPRYLHSTGQLHKGGPRELVVIQAVRDDTAGDDVPVPGKPFTFGELLHAQADGDLEVLRERGVRSGRVSLDALLGLVV